MAFWDLLRAIFEHFISYSEPFLAFWELLRAILSLFRASQEELGAVLVHTELSGSSP